MTNTRFIKCTSCANITAIDNRYTADICEGCRFNREICRVCSTNPVGKSYGCKITKMCSDCHRVQLNKEIYGSKK